VFADWQHPERIPPVLVLGFVLRGPLTLGHVLLLDELGSPIVRGESFNLGDLALAAFALAQPADESRKDLKKWWAAPFMSWRGRQTAKLDFEQEATRFSEWFSEQCGGPTIDTGDEKMAKRSKPASAPWYISKLALAVGELGMSVGDAYDMPVKRLNQLVGALLESRGDVTFITDKTAAALAQVEEWDRELAKGAA